MFVYKIDLRGPVGRLGHSLKPSLNIESRIKRRAWVELTIAFALFLVTVVT